MSPKKRPPEEMPRTVEQLADEDELERIMSLSDDEVDAELRAAGGDPAAIRARGAAQAAALDERYGRLAWKGDAKRKLDAFRARAAAMAGGQKRTREELLARIGELRNHPRFSAPAAALFRKRREEESSDEELESLVQELELLIGLKEDT